MGVSPVLSLQQAAAVPVPGEQAATIPSAVAVPGHRSSATVTGHRPQSPVIAISHWSATTVTGHQPQSLAINHSHRPSTLVSPPTYVCVFFSMESGCNRS
jgi:hypothetical protein